MKQLLKFSGIDEERLCLRWISSAEGPEFAHAMQDFVAAVRALGPSPLNRSAKAEAA